MGDERSTENKTQNSVTAENVPNDVVGGGETEEGRGEQMG